MRSFACLVALLPFLSLAQVATDPEVPADPAAVLDALYAKRGTAAADAELNQQVDALARAYPENVEVLWRAARWKAWFADGASDNKAREAIAKEGWALGDRARALKPEHARAHYEAAANVGLCAAAGGILNALGQGLEGKFNERLDRALQLDPTVAHGGPWMLKGRYHFELPWPLRDLKKSRDLLEKATAKFPLNLRAQLYLAETLSKDGRSAEARAVLKQVLEGTPVDPPEAARVRAMARKIEAAVARAN